MYIKSLIAAVALMVTGVSFAGTLGSFSSTDPLNNGFQGTRLWTDPAKTGFNVVVGAGTSDVKFGDKSELGAGLDYKWSNGFYTGGRIIGTEHTDRETGYLGYTGKLIDASTPFWAQVGVIRLHDAYGWSSITNTWTEAQLGAEKRSGRSRVGLAGSYAKNQDFDVALTKVGLYAEVPLDLVKDTIFTDWRLRAIANRVRAESFGTAAYFNQYQVAVGRVFSNGIGFQLAADRTSLAGADTVASAKISIQF